MNRQRMIDTIELLKNLHETKPDSFYYDYWGGSDSYPFCGTHQCAGGAMAIHPPFNAQGLTTLGKNFYKPYFEGHTGVMALALFLDISYDAAEAAFVELHERDGEKCRADDITAIDVASFLQELLDGNTPCES